MADQVPKKKTSKGSVIVGVILLVIVISALSKSKSSSTTSASSANSSTSEYVLPAAVTPTGVVTYSISGNFTSASLTYQTPTGSTQKVIYQAGNVQTATFDAGGFVYLSAQNDGDSGSVTCTITEDGTVMSTNTATGAYTIATCNGQA